MVNHSVAYQHIFKILLSEFSTDVFLSYFSSIRQIALQLKVFDVFCDYVLDNIDDIISSLSSNILSAKDSIILIKTLHYNKKFYEISLQKRLDIVENILDFVYSCNSHKIDNNFIQGVILLFAITNKNCYRQYIEKYKITNNDIVEHNYFVTYFGVHPFLSYQMCDKNYEQYLENNLKKGYDYILSTFFIKLINKSNDFDAVAEAFLKLAEKHQRKILNPIKRLYDYFENIDLNINNITNISIYGYVFISFFKNAGDYITEKHILLLEKICLPEHKELFLFIKQKLGDTCSLYDYINQNLSNKSLVSLPLMNVPIKDLFEHISHVKIEKSNKNYLCSVIITTYNPDIDFLTLSVTSLLNQTLKNVEIIIIDDCSDNSDAIKKLQEKSNAIKYICNDINQGAYLSRNTAINHSTGDYIFFQDDDDVSHPQRLEYSVDNLLKSKAKIFHTCVMRFSYNGLVQLDTNATISSDGPVSMCFHRDTFNELGMFANFRSRGDVEYRARCIKRFGLDSYFSMMDIPLYYALGSGTSLSISFEASASFYNLEINRNIIAEAVI